MLCFEVQVYQHVIVKIRLRTFAWMYHFLRVQTLWSLFLMVLEMAALVMREFSSEGDVLREPQNTRLVLICNEFV